MLRLVRRSLLVLCALALVGGSTISFAAFVTPASPCVHEHAHHGDSVPTHHDHHGAGCLACCLAACTTLAGLPPRTFVAIGGFDARAVAYWETSVSLAGRSIAPDPAPPRTIA